jgi:pimeloyl-ACP methyl ester carboxylesterase
LSENNQPNETLRPLSIFYTCQGSPDHPAILLIHGFPTSSFDFYRLVTALAPDYYLCALDTPGYGFSDKPNDAYEYSLFDDAALVDYFVRTKLARKTFTLLTHDKGDSVGLIFLQRYLEDHSYPAQLTQHIILNGNLYLPLAILSAVQNALLDPHGQIKTNVHNRRDE